MDLKKLIVRIWLIRLPKVFILLLILPGGVLGQIGQSWQERAEAGSAFAQNNLGIMYAQGEGVEEDVELSEFSDEIEDWVIKEFAKIGLDTAKSILEQDVNDLIKRTDLEEETVREVLKVLREEFEE